MQIEFLNATLRFGAYQTLKNFISHRTDGELSCYYIDLLLSGLNAVSALQCEADMHYKLFKKIKVPKYPTTLQRAHRKKMFCLETQSSRD